MKKILILIIITLLIFTTFYFLYQYLGYYIAEELVIIVEDNNTTMIKDIKAMFNIDQDVQITKMKYIQGFPEGFNLDIIIKDKQNEEQHIFFSEAVAYSEKKSYLQSYFKDEGKRPIEQIIYPIVIIINIVCVVILIIYSIVKLYYKSKT